MSVTSFLLHFSKQLSQFDMYHLSLRHIDLGHRHGTTFPYLLVMTKAMETRWFYHGPDDQTYGPYSAKDMVLWCQSGYFNDQLPIRTEHEERFNPLGEWTRLCGGKLPFTLPILSMDHLMSHMQHAVRGPINPLQMMLPPGLPPPFPPPPNAHMRFPFMPGMPGGGAPLSGGGGGSIGPNGVPLTMSQPPSEPHDGGHSSASQTPDSDNDYSETRTMQGMHTQNVHNNHNMSMGGAVGVHVGTQVFAPSKVSTGSDPIVAPRRDAVTQTMPLIVNSKDAARLLSELLGHVVHVT